MPKGIRNKNMRRLNMHLENQIRRAKYINPNRKVMLSQAWRKQQRFRDMGKFSHNWFQGRGTGGSAQAAKG